MSDLLDWLTQTKKQRRAVLLRSIQDRRFAPTDYLSLVDGGSLGIYASRGPHFRYAMFGRDSVEVAEDILDINPELAHRIILACARLQGVSFDATSEEEPGKIHHEYRARVLEGKKVPERSRQLLRRLQRYWGKEGADDMVYYGAFDATPLYIRLIGRFVDHFGSAILEEIYTGRDGRPHTIKDSMRAATVWLTRKLGSSSWGLLEYKRLNPHGLANQSWKDSITAYVHINGQVANYELGIASVELQGYAYDALQAAAQHVADTKTQKELWQGRAKQLQRDTLDLLWMPEARYFAQGLDRDRVGHTRQIKMLSSNGALLLESTLLKDLPYQQRHQYVEGIIRTIYSDDFVTAAGIRSRARRHAYLLSTVDYHGSLTVWPKETYDIAKGLRQHRFIALATELENRIIDSVLKSGNFYEFFYVKRNGSIYYDRDEAVRDYALSPRHPDFPIPEEGQAWVISAFVAILASRQTSPANHQAATSMELSLVKSLPLISIIYQRPLKT